MVGKITDLTAGVALTGTELFESVQSAASVKLTANQSKTFNSASPTFTGVVGLPAGSAAAPSLVFGTDASGWYRIGSAQWGFTNGSQASIQIFPALLFNFSSTILLGWSATTDATAGHDTGLSRLSAGVLAVGTGTASNHDAQVYAGTLRTNQTTVAGLPSAATAGAGATAFVTDANATFILGLGLAAVGGGANKVPVYSDGTNWIVG